VPVGEGWFLDMRTGRALSVREHETAVRADPHRFRIRPEEVEGKDRAELLTLVFKRRFIRVRWDKSGVVFEFHGGRKRALRLIRRFLLAHEAGPYTPVRINDLADDRFRKHGVWDDMEKTLLHPRKETRQ